MTAKNTKPDQLPRERGTSHVARLIEQALGGVAIGAFRKPAITLAVAGVMLALSLFAAQRLTLNADLTTLLPESFKSIQDLDRLEERFGGVGYMVVVGLDADEDGLRRFANEMAPRLEALSEIRYVDYRRPVSFFRDRALYFLDLQDLEKLHDRLAERYAYEKRKANPMFIDLEGEAPPPVDFSDIVDKYTASDDYAFLRSNMADELYIDADSHIVALLLKPIGNVSDLAYTRVVNDQVKELIDGVDLTQYGEDFRVAYSGRFAKRVAQQHVIERDLSLITSVAFLLMLLYLALHFRRFAAVVLIAGPLVLGVVWTFGFAGVAFGMLNILTGFVGVILLGLGLDHGIHLLGRFEDEYDPKRDLEEVIRETFANTGRGVTIAGLTTTVGFAGLAISEFRAFRELGTLAAVGMILMVLAYTAVLPAMLGAAARLGWKPKSLGPEGNDSPYVRRIGRWAPTLLVFSAVFFLLPAVGWSSLRFDFDFGALKNSELEEFQLDEPVNVLLGYNQDPVAILVDNQDQEREVAQKLREQQRALGDASRVDFVATVSDLIPLDQEDKQVWLERIGRILKKLPASAIDEEFREVLDIAISATQTPPFGRADIPLELTRQFLGPDANLDEGFVLLFPNFKLEEGQRVREFAAQIREVRLDDGEVISAAGEAMFLADIINMVFGEAPWVLSLALLLVFLTLWFLLGSLELAFLCLLPAAVSLFATLGLLPLVGEDLNYLNIVMIPVLFGIGVDGGAHLVTRLAGKDDLQRVFNETGRAIAGASLTTGLGFGALMLANHPGLNSLGKLATLGLAVNLVACLVMMPALLSRWFVARHAAPAPAQDVDAAEPQADAKAA